MRDLDADVETIWEEGLASQRALYVKDLEKQFPVNDQLITAQEVIDLQFVNALLTMIDVDAPIYTSSDKTADQEDILFLQGMREVLADKIIRVIALALLREYRYYHEGSLSEDDHPEEITHIDIILNNHRNEVVQSNHPNGYKQRLIQLESLVKENKLTRLEIQEVLRLIYGDIDEGNWKEVCNEAYKASISRREEQMVRVETLLMMMHNHGGPILQYIANRPWEIANVLTCVHVGLLNACPTKPSESLIRVARKLRMSEIMQTYLSSEQVRDSDVKKLFNDASLRLPLYKIAMLFNTLVPIELLMKYYPQLFGIHDSSYPSSEYRYSIIQSSLGSAHQEITDILGIVSRIKR